MKVLILAIPRSYTKTLQKAVANQLGDGQQTLRFADGAQHRVALWDVLSFEESTSKAWNPQTKSWVPSVKQTDVQHYRPVPTTDGLVMQECERRSVIAAEEVMAVAQAIVDDPRPAVLRFFPTKMYAPLFGWKDDKTIELLKLLIGGFDKVLVQFRLDAYARAVSMASYQKFLHLGTTEKYRPSEEDIRKSWEYEARFRRLCITQKLRPVYAEDVARLGPAVAYGDPWLPAVLPKEIEFSDKEFATELDFVKCNCEFMPAATRQRLLQDPLYKSVFEMKRGSMENAPGFISYNKGLPKWQTETDFNNWMVAEGRKFNKLLLEIQKGIVNGV